MKEELLKIAQESLSSHEVSQNDDIYPDAEPEATFS